MAQKVGSGHVWDGIEIDITERKRAEEALRESESKFRMLHQSMMDAFVTVDMEGRITDYNEAYLQMLSYTPEEISTLTYRDITPEKWHAFEADIVEKQVLPCGYSSVYEKEYRRKDGTVFPVELRTTLLRDTNGSPMHMWAIVRDITARKKLEDERRKLDAHLNQVQRHESLGVLAGGIAHDFNNILMAILGYADLTLDELSPLASGRENIQQIKKAAMRAAELCTQMLAYSGKSRLEPQTFCLNHMAEEMLHILKVSISKKCVLNLNLEKQLPLIHGDVSQVRQVLMNLIINASEAIGDLSGSITVSTSTMNCSAEYLEQNYIAPAPNPGLYVYMEVSDTGCGMSQETMQRMFEPFFTTKFTGRGLGLSAVLGIVQAHHGSLRVYSELGKGTTIKLLFPAAAGSVSGNTESPAEPQWRGRGTVLLVDDEESIRTITGKLLERLGLDVLTAKDGQEAVELYRDRKADIAVVLLDLTMPRMGGEEAFRELRQINPDVRVILASGYSESDITARFAGKGLAGCLQKPYLLTSLRSSLSALLPVAGGV